MTIEHMNPLPKFVATPLGQHTTLLISNSSYTTNRYLYLMVVTGNSLDDIYSRMFVRGENNRKRTFKDVVWHAYLWYVWKGRNDAVFLKTVFTPQSVVDGIQRLAFLWVHSRCSFGRYLKLEDWSCFVNSV